MGCSVPGCRVSPKLALAMGLKIFYYEFPNNQTLRQLWINSCKLPVGTNIDKAMVCTQHFGVDDFERPALKENVVPSLGLPEEFEENQDECTLLVDDTNCVSWAVTAKDKDFELDIQKLEVNFDVKPEEFGSADLPASSDNTSPPLVQSSKSLITENTQNTSLKCPLCGYTTERRPDFLRHLSRHAGKLLKCADCDYASAERLEFSQHIQTHLARFSLWSNADKKFKCSSCNFASARPWDLKKHNKVMHATDKHFKCSMCDYTCTKRFDFRRHLKSHPEYKPFKCSNCDYAGVLRCNLLIHMRKVHTKDKTYLCEVCGSRFVCLDYLKQHVKQHRLRDQKQYKCKSCDYATYEKSRLKDHHLCRHTEERPIKCDMCNFATKSRAVLRGHILARHPAGDSKMPYKCSVCEHRCLQRSHLRAHMRIHTGERPYKCMLCEMAFTQRGALTIHTRRRHTDERPFKCDACDKCFVDSQSLKKHYVSVHTQERPFKCGNCDYGAARSSHLARHIMRKHSQ